MIHKPLYMGIDPSMTHTGVAFLADGVAYTGKAKSLHDLEEMLKQMPNLEGRWSLHALVEYPKTARSYHLGKFTSNRSTSVVQAAGGEAERILRRVFPGAKLIERIDPLDAKKMMSFKGDRRPYKEIIDMYLSTTTLANSEIVQLRMKGDGVKCQVVPFADLTRDELDALAIAHLCRVLYR